jgi:uroporphyrinogen-III synthase
VSEGALAGYGVLVTRPAGQSAELADAIADAGGRAIRFPVIDIVGAAAADVGTAFAALPRADLIVFVSRNAVTYGLAAIDTGNSLIAVVGPATKAAVEENGTHVDIVPERGSDSEQLLAHPQLQDVAGKTIIIVRGERGREKLAETLRLRGATICYLPVYERQLHRASAAELAALEKCWSNSEIDCVTVMSVETLQNLLQLLPAPCRKLLVETPLVAPSTRVIQTAEESIPGISTILAPGPQAADIISALIALRQSGQNR